VKFHDGTSFDAKSREVLLRRGPPVTRSRSKASLYTPVVQGAEVIDDSTVRVILKQPFGAFLFIMAHSAGAIVSPAAHQKWGKDLALHPVGTGPFKFVEWVKGDHVTMERHDGYWGGRAESRPRRGEDRPGGPGARAHARVGRCRPDREHSDGGDPAAPEGRAVHDRVESHGAGALHRDQRQEEALRRRPRGGRP